MVYMISNSSVIGELNSPVSMELMDEGTMSLLNDNSWQPTSASSSAIIEVDRSIVDEVLDRCLKFYMRRRRLRCSSRRQSCGDGVRY